MFHRASALLLACLIVLVFPAGVFAEDMEAQVARFYNGLSDIMERNMNNPDSCVSETKRFVDANQAFLIKMQELAKKGMQQAQDMQHPSMDQADMQKAMEEMSKSEAAQATTRWAQAMMQFSMQNPEHAGQIAEIMSRFMPKNQFME